LALTAESAESLLPTIVSRCELISLRPLTFEQVSLGLQEHHNLSSAISAETAQFLAHISNGRPGYAIRLSQEPERLEQRSLWLDDQWHLLRASRVERFAFADKLSKDKGALRSVIQVWLSFWRDVLLRAAESSVPITNLDRLDEIERLSSKLSIQTILNFISTLERTLELMQRNANIRLATDVLLLNLPAYQY
jgi:DNA polymerase-3 subunit delta'